MNIVSRRQFMNTLLDIIKTNPS